MWSVSAKVRPTSRSTGGEDDPESLHPSAPVLAQEPSEDQLQQEEPTPESQDITPEVPRPDLEVTSWNRLGQLAEERTVINVGSVLMSPGQLKDLEPVTVPEAGEGNQRLNEETLKPCLHPLCRKSVKILSITFYSFLQKKKEANLLLPDFQKASWGSPLPSD